MKDWQVAIVAVCMAVALFVGIDSLVKAQPWAHEPCEYQICRYVIDKYEDCDDNHCRDMMKVLIESTCKFSSNHQ